MIESQRQQLLSPSDYYHSLSTSMTPGSIPENRETTENKRRCELKTSFTSMKDLTHLIVERLLSRYCPLYSRSEIFQLYNDLVMSLPTRPTLDPDAYCSYYTFLRVIFKYVFTEKKEKKQKEKMLWAHTSSFISFFFLLSFFIKDVLW